MNILFVATGLDTQTGTYEVIFNVSKILLKKHKVTLLTDIDSKINVPYTKIIKLKTKNIFFKKYKFMPDLKKILINSELDNYDVIHIFEYLQHTTDFLTLKKHQIKPPIIISLHATLNDVGQFPINLLKKIHNWIMLRYQKRISYFLVSSLAEKKDVLTRNIPDEKIKILPPAMKVFPIQKNNSDKKKIVYVGRLAITKNVDILIEAFAKMKTKNIQLVIAGPDFGMLKSLQKITHSYGLDNQVTFTGWISEEKKMKLLSEATIFVHPSLKDVFLLSLLEAASIGVPCVAFDVESNSEILENGITGIIVENISAQGLAEKLDLLLSDNELYEKISKNSKILLPKKFSWESTAQILEDIYNELI